MTDVAVHGSLIKEVIVPDYVTYKIEDWIPKYCAAADETGCISYGGEYWQEIGTGKTGAKVTGTVSVPSSKLKVQGKNVAKVGDATIETWTAHPPIPTSTNSRKYTANGLTSGSGQGEIIGGSTKGKIGSSAIALVGSQVRTHLNNQITTIQDGINLLNMNS